MPGKVLLVLALFLSVSAAEKPCLTFGKKRCDRNLHRCEWDGKFCRIASELPTEQPTMEPTVEPTPKKNKCRGLSKRLCKKEKKCRYRKKNKCVVK